LRNVLIVSAYRGSENKEMFDNFDREKRNIKS